jgi:hypothetical protein
MHTLRIMVLRRTGNLARGEYWRHLSAEKVQRVKLFRSVAAKFVRAGNIRNANGPSRVGKFQTEGLPRVSILS